MSTYKNHVLLSVVEENGDVNEMFPQSNASDVSISRSNKNIPAGIENVQELVDNMGAAAFQTADKLVYVDSTKNYDGELIETEINDTTTSTVTTWSSKKINDFVKKSAPEFKSLMDTTERLINEVLPIVPQVYNVNTTGFSQTSFPTGNPGNYIVEYFPFVNKVSNVEADISSPYCIDYAMQRWTLLKSSTGDDNTAKVFTRFFVNGAWTQFK